MSLVPKSFSLEHVGEIKNLLKWLGDIPRSQHQLNRLNESDCEIVKINENLYFTTTVDSLSDEISLGLYKDPYTMGWVCAQAPLSDLAAVGSEPMGLLFSAQWALETSTDFKKKVMHGFHDALKSSHTFLLGGDTGSSLSTVLTSVGQGTCSRIPISRVGIQEGDYLCITGKTGIGPALSFRLLRGENASTFLEEFYRPQGRLQEGSVLSKYATAMIDTSDGVLSSINTLYSLNNIGFELLWNPEILDERSVQYCKQRNIPLWFLWIGEHGDFELIFTISPANYLKVKEVCPHIHIIGRAVNREQRIKLKIPAEFALGSQEERILEVNLDKTQMLNSGSAVNLKNLSSYFFEFVSVLRSQGFP